MIFSHSCQKRANRLRLRMGTGGTNLIGLFRYWLQKSNRYVTVFLIWNKP